MRVLIWSQHLLGTGHLQRSSRLAEALARSGHAVTLANGGPAPADHPLAWRRVDLPAIRAADAGFGGLVDEAGTAPTATLWEARREHLEALAAERPDLVVLEMFPFGRRAFTAELAPLLERWRSSPERPAIAVSLRDVLVEKLRADRAIEVAERVERWVDVVLVHGDPRLIALDATFPATRRIAGYLRYTGYVAPPPPAPGGRPRTGVLVSVGGGAVGRALLTAAVGAARRLGGTMGPWTVITGRNVANAELCALEADAPSGLVILRHVDDLPERLARARVSISQAGYNTVIEALAARCPMILVPFAVGEETEQTRRALAVARSGAATVLEEASLTAERLADAITERAGVPFPRLSVASNGAAASVCRLERLRGLRR